MSTCYTCQQNPGGGNQRGLRAQARRRALRASARGEVAGLDGLELETIDAGPHGFWAEQGRRLVLTGVALSVDLGAAVGIGILNRWGDNTGLFLAPLLLVALFLVSFPLLLWVRHRRDAALLFLAEDGVAQDGVSEDEGA